MDGSSLASFLAYDARIHMRTRRVIECIPPPGDLARTCRTPGNVEIPVWKWLRAKIEHEIHHRGQLYVYLSILQIPAPPLFGLTSEEVHRMSS